MAKKNGKKSVTTIPGLARLMQEEFSNVYGRMDAGFADVHKRMDAGFLEIHNRLGNVETDVGVLKMDMHEVKRDIQEMKEKSSELFEKLNKFIALYQETKQELTIMAKQLRRLEERVAHLEGKR